MALSDNVERVDSGSPDGATIRGHKKPVYLNNQVNTVDITESDSGRVYVFNKASGIVFTLPPAQEGLYYDFICTNNITSNAAKVITASSSDLLIGGVMIASQTIAESGDFFEADGSTHVAISSNGTTTGGLRGGWFRVYAADSTFWTIWGVLQGSGTTATPFATS